MEYKQPEGLAPGIYFNLPEPIYREDPALNYSGIKDLIENPESYWQKGPLNPGKKQRKDTDEMKYGRALHSYILEPETFTDIYFIMPGQKWQDGKEMIISSNYKKLLQAEKVIKGMPTPKRFLANGYPEVTFIVYCPTFQLRFKCRIDYLKTWCAIDYKTEHDISISGIKRAFWRWGYDIQNALYKYVVGIAKEQLQEGLLHVWIEPGVPFENKEFFQQFIADKGNDFVFIFQNKEEPYQIEILDLTEDEIKEGLDSVIEGVDVYKKFIAEFGAKPWIRSDTSVKRFSKRYGVIEQ